MGQVERRDRIPTRPFDEDTLEPFALCKSDLAMAYVAESVVRSEMTPDSVVVAGLPSSGATLLSLLVQSAGLQVVQIHGYSDAFWRLVVYRDPRDCICSLARRCYENESQDESLRLAYSEILVKYLDAVTKYQGDSHVCLIQYEEFLPDNIDKLIKVVAEYLGMCLTAEFEKYLTWEYSLTRMKARAGRLESFSYWNRHHVHGKHITNDGRPGAWRRLFSPDTCQFVRDGLAEFLIVFGYEENCDWVDS